LDPGSIPGGSIFLEGVMRIVNGRVKTVEEKKNHQLVCIATDEGEYEFKVEGKEPGFSVLQKVEISIADSGAIFSVKRRK
jgi:hypothetical protein